MKFNEMKPMTCTEKHGSDDSALSSFVCTHEWETKCDAVKADLFRGSRGMPGNVCDDPLRVISSEQKS